MGLPQAGRKESYAKIRKRKYQEESEESKERGKGAAKPD